MTVYQIAQVTDKGKGAYTPYGGALQLWLCKAPEVIISGPAETGKTMAACHKIDTFCWKYPHTHALMVRKSYKSTVQSVLQTYERKVLGAWHGKRFDPDKSPVKPFGGEKPEWYDYPNGSRIVIGGMDNPDKVLSSEYDVIYVNQAEELEIDDWEKLSTRCTGRAGNMPYAQLMGDCNPGPPDHWILQRTAAGSLTFLESRHEDNPTLFDPDTGEITEQGKRTMASLDALTGVRKKRLRYGQWVGAEGQYFTEWDEDQHICEPFPIPETWTRWQVNDYGFADPWCGLWFARSPADKSRFYIYRESYAAGLRDEQQAAAILNASKGERISVFLGDPSMFNNRTEQGKPSIATVYWRTGVPLRPGINDRLYGWQTVRRVLAWDPEHKPRLQIMRGRAPNLVRTLPAMVHDPLDSEDLADKIKGVKTEDHGVDALRYGCVLEAMPEQQQAKLMSFQVVQ